MTALSPHRRGSEHVLRLSRFLGTGQAMAGLIMLAFVVVVGVFGPLLAPHSLAQPIGAPGAPPGGGAPLGTDYLGRDVLSRVLDGGVPVLALVAATVTAVYLIGGTIGMMAGLSRSILDPILMRAVDLFLVFPPLLLLLLLLAGAGTSQFVLGVGIVLVLFPGVARLVRTATLEVSTTNYVEAAVARGERTFAIMWREILPNISPAVLADLGVRFSVAIILAASVNFLGLGSSPPAANWGLMVSENREIMVTNPWAVLVPAAMLALLTISVNLLADAFVRSHGRTEVRV